LDVLFAPTLTPYPAFSARNPACAPKSEAQSRTRAALKIPFALPTCQVREATGIPESGGFEDRQTTVAFFLEILLL